MVKIQVCYEEDIENAVDRQIAEHRIRGMIVPDHQLIVVANGKCWRISTLADYEDFVEEFADFCDSYLRRAKIITLCVITRQVQQPALLD